MVVRDGTAKLLWHAHLVNIGGDHFAGADVQAVLHEEYLFKSHAHHFPGGKDQHDGSGGKNGRQIDMQHPAEPAGSVNLGGFVKLRINIA